MPAPIVPMVITQGEDFTSDIIWTDNYDDGMNVVHPCRLEVRAAGGQVVLALDSDPDIPEGEIPGISISSDIGLVQLHIPKHVTNGLLPGQYFYDMMVTHDDGNEFVGTQAVPLVAGPCTVNKSYSRV